MTYNCPRTGGWGKNNCPALAGPNARKKYQSEGERSEPELRRYVVRILR